jgi:hypothetical protein
MFGPRTQEIPMKRLMLLCPLVFMLACLGCAPGQQEQGLVGKPAPDLQGDFAVNGKPVHLSDLKGKVVLLDFWAPS